MKLENDRVYLRPVEEKDLNDIFEYAKDEDTGPRAGWPAHKTIDDTKMILDKWLSPQNSEMILAIVYKENNKMIGTLGIADLNKNPKDENNKYVADLLKQGKVCFELGTTLSKAYWNKGLSTDIIKIVEKYLFLQRNADCIIIGHYAENMASRRVQEKNNYKEVYSYERDTAWYNTNCKTMIVRCKTRAEWEMENEKR